VLRNTYSIWGVPFLMWNWQWLTTFTGWYIWYSACLKADEHRVYTLHCTHPTHYTYVPSQEFTPSVQVQPAFKIPRVCCQRHRMSSIFHSHPLRVSSAAFNHHNIPFFLLNFPEESQWNCVTCVIKSGWGDTDLVRVTSHAWDVTEFAWIYLEASFIHTLAFGPNSSYILKIPWFLVSLFLVSGRFQC
jgi:hypothetical protein